MTQRPNNGQIDPSPLPKEPAPGHRSDFWARLDDALDDEASPVRPLAPKASSWASRPATLMAAAALILVAMIATLAVRDNREPETTPVTTEGRSADDSTQETAPTTIPATPAPTAAAQPTPASADEIAVPAETTGTRVCTAGDFTTWGPASVRMRFTEFDDRIVVQYAHHGTASFDGAAEGQAVSARTEGSPTIDEELDRYLVGGASDPAFGQLVRQDDRVVQQRADLAASISCEARPEPVDTEEPLAPQGVLADGPWSCAFDPELGMNPLGMRAFVTVESHSDGRVQWISWQFGNVVNDGAGYITVTLTGQEVADQSADALEILPSLAGRLQLDEDIAGDLATVMSCSRNPEATDDFPAGFPYDAESQASRDANGIEGSEGYYYFESDSFDWFAYPGWSENRCNGGLSYDIDITDRESGETAVAITGLAVNRILTMNIDEANGWIFVLAECDGMTSAHAGRLAGIGPWTESASYDLPGVVNPTGITFDDDNTFRVSVVDGPDVVVNR